MSIFIFAAPSCDGSPVATPVSRERMAARFPFDLKLGGAAGRRRPLHDKGGMHFCRHHTIGRAAHASAKPRRKLGHDVAQAVQLARIEIEG